jgi:spore coat polysaccharide biosynthesis protein SpsF
MPGTVAIIQARTGSTRLPRKSLARVLGRPLLDLMLERVQRAVTLDEIVVATTTFERDDEIAHVARGRGATVFRGSENDVLGRYVGAASFADAQVVVRLTADCPLLDPAIVDRIVTARRTLGKDADLVTNAPPLDRTYPDGMDVEVFTLDALVRADALATTIEDREHVTRRFHRAPFRSTVIDLDPPAGDVRLTVDDGEDLDTVRAIYEDLQPHNPAFGLAEMLAWLDASLRTPGTSPVRCGL